MNSPKQLQYPGLVEEKPLELVWQEVLKISELVMEKNPELNASLLMRSFGIQLKLGQEDNPHKLKLCMANG